MTLAAFFPDKTYCTLPKFQSATPEALNKTTVIMKNYSYQV